MRKPLPFFFFALGGVAFDQATKYWVFGTVPPSGQPLIQGILNLKPVLNPGVAFSLFNSYPTQITTIGVLFLVALTYWYFKGWRAAPSSLILGQGLLLAGALGNLIDRLFPPYMVRDFFEFIPKIPLIGHWAIFNWADIFICTGTGCFLLATLRKQEMVGPRYEAPVDGPENQKGPNQTGRMKSED